MKTEDLNLDDDQQNDDLSGLNDEGNITFEMLNDDNEEFEDLSEEFLSEYQNDNGDDSGDGEEDPGSSDDNKNADPNLNLGEEEEEEVEDIELDKLNKSLGTNFSSIEELKKSLQKEVTIDEKKEEDIKLNKAQAIVNNLSDYLKLDNKELVRKNLIALGFNKGKDVSSQEFLDEVEAKIQSLEDNETLDDYAEQTRISVSTAIEKNKAVVDQINGKRQKAEEDERKQNTDSLIAAFTDIHKKGNFFGLQVSTDDIKDVFKKVKDGTFFEDVNKNQEKIAKLALMYYKSEDIEKRATGPTQSDGIEKLGKELGLFGTKQQNNKKASVANANASGSQKGIVELANALIS